MMLNIWSVTVVILLVSELAPRAQADQDPTTPLNCTNMKILQGVCLPGSTYRSAAVNGTAAGCCAACAADGVKCVAWTIDTYRCPGPKCCSLKSASTQTPDPSPNCTSGLPTPPPTPPPRPAPPIPPPAPPNPAAPRPHIVFVLADDLGWYDTAVYNPVSPTPGIAQLAASGIRLDHMYVFRYCSPTRRSFLSGRFPTLISTVQPDSKNMCSNFLPLAFTTLPEKLATAGYVSHHVGKGHEGYQTTDHLPINRGFSSHLGYLSGGPLNYFHGSGSPEPFVGVHDLWHDHEPGWDVVPGMFYSANTYANVSVSIIKNFSSTASPTERLFLYLPMQNVHSPYQMPPAFETKPFPAMWDNTYANMLKLLDDAVVNVTQALKDTALWDNTILWFSADNGGIGLGNNHPLRGHKHDPWEGGTRATAFVSGGFVPTSLRGTHSGPKLVHIADLYATFCTLAGVDPRDDVWMANELRSIDGVDVWPMLTAAGNGTQPRAVTPTTEGGIIEVVDVGGGLKTWWKLVNLGGQSVYYDENQTQTSGTFPCLDQRQPDPPQPAGPFGPGRTDPLVNGCPVCNATMPCLFDLLEDPRETTNVASQQPKVVARLTALLSKYNEHYVTGSLAPETLEANYTLLTNRSATWRGYEGPCWVRKDGVGVPRLDANGLWSGSSAHPLP